MGYDHKAMGITARGAWESVRYHFRERGLDIQSEDFTVVGVGDMSGDVFGNGMLLSEHIRLVAAFDHRHIFLDPTPDAAVSFAERRRLFELPRSSWADYNSSLISDGGGVFPRTLKSVPISPAVASSLGLAAGTTALPPIQLMHAILVADVDLLWNGGIGTYVKASSESDAEVGDKANDGLARGRGRRAGPGDRRGRQPGLHPARADRVRAGRWRHQHRRDRQLGRRRHVRPRGQHQDPARPDGRGRFAGRGRAKPDPGRGDRRGGRGRAHRQLRAERAARAGTATGRADGVGVPAADPGSGAGRAPGPIAGVPADGQGDGPARHRRPRPGVAAVGGAGRLRQDHADPAARSVDTAG